jgi:hypothetical protein
MTLKEYLESKNSSSSFTATQSDVGGNITFSNSGNEYVNAINIKL